MTLATSDADRPALGRIGLRNTAKQFWNLHHPPLIVEALHRCEAELSERGALVARTGKRTGRSPRDKFIVREPGTERNVHWGKVNAGTTPEVFDALRSKVFDYLATRDVFVQDLYCGADPANRIRVRVICQFAWHALFARALFVRPPADELADFEPDFTVVAAPEFAADPAADGTNSETFVMLNFAEKMVLIGGTRYAGEIKKSIFTVMNYLLPLGGVLSMHCSANVGQQGDTALFFGLSGTGKTTLSADPTRRLIGDDEHGWSDRGVFNFEGGCYAKVINLSARYEPQIYNAIRFGAVLENVVLDPITGAPRFEDASLTENTRAAYPLEFIDNSIQPSLGDHPRNVVFLTCDAFGVLPPVARLTPEQAMYHFLSGYTAKVAGTEAGVTEPQATFSSCFGAPFLPLNPTVYADQLGARIARHNARVWLVNTGWSGGPYGQGQRMSLPHTRALVDAALTGKLDEVEYRPHPVFGVEMPRKCPDVPAKVLDPRRTWADPADYDAKAAHLAGLFVENFRQFDADDAIRAAGPRA